MKTQTLLRVATSVLMAGLAFLPIGPASAAIGTAAYTIIVKDARGGFMSCSPSGLSFADSQLKADGFYPVASPAPQIKICNGLNPSLLPFTFDTNDSLQVGVFKSTINGQDQGANVAGLTGRMTGTKVVGNTTFKLAIDFTLSGPDANGKFTRNYTIMLIPATGAERQVAVGSYHVSNPAAVPEPGTIALLMIGLLGFTLAARRAR